MTEYAVLISVIALCLFWCALRERLEGNGSDGRLLTSLGAFSGLGGLGMLLVGLE